MESLTLPPVHIAAKILANTASVHAASRKSGIPVAEIRRLKKHDPEFQALVLEYSTSITIRCAKQLEHLVPLAIKVLAEELAIPNTSGSTVRRGRPSRDSKYAAIHPREQTMNQGRVRAAKIVIESWHKTKDLYDTNIRLNDLEQAMFERKMATPVTVEVLPETCDTST